MDTQAGEVGTGSLKTSPVMGGCSCCHITNTNTQQQWGIMRARTCELIIVTLFPLPYVAQISAASSTPTDPPPTTHTRAAPAMHPAARASSTRRASGVVRAS